jgi:hypothetical protein
VNVAIYDGFGVKHTRSADALSAHTGILSVGNGSHSRLAFLLCLQISGFEFLHSEAGKIE